MARKMKTKKTKVTAEKNKIKASVTDLGKSFVDLKAASDAYRQSYIAYHIEGIVEVIGGNSTLAPWEIEAMNNLIEKFNTKYNSPLAKVMR